MFHNDKEPQLTEKDRELISYILTHNYDKNGKEVTSND